MANDYYKNLPKKRMGAGAIIMNDTGEILFVKASYKDHWTLPGGVVEKDESPKIACLREVKEETGLSLADVKFLGVDYAPAREEKNENLQFVFFGGKLSASEMKNIKVDGQEIVEYRFIKIDDALPLLNDKLKRRLPQCLAALENNTAVYLENGK
ncbi:MAG: NUDIX hydrolase [bacterium]|nr:NUDIX hydrolase [bacterium]